MKSAFERRVFFDGELIFKEGDGGGQAFLVESGQVLLSKLGADDQTIEIAQIGARSLFGEMAVIDQSARMASARAIGKTTLMEIDKLVLEQKLESVDEDIRKLFEMLLHYIRDTLPYNERGKTELTALETNMDALARRTLQSPIVTKANELEDLFLVALFQSLAAYAARRLPPEG
ncbi:MAG: cyclic nucleotide-binding domain-containing protein [Rhodospirillales bacterium]|nr:cyclic nucleotide-binding domain-containing protein [Rhodospirillales bacterium]